MLFEQYCQFSNQFVQLGPEFYSFVTPQPFKNPKLIHVNTKALDLLNLPHQIVDSEQFLNILSGHKPFQSLPPIAMIYAGHQFGGYSPELGDGRGVLLGQIKLDNQLWDIHLKGAGLTPYSRHGDGRAVLRSTIREYLASEALHNLGIPTTRALCIIGGDEPVYREQIETGAMLVRLGRSHIRFGSFEYFHYTKNFNAVKKLADHVISEYLPQHVNAPDCYEQLLKMATIRTAHLIVQWQCIGFAHGVMNTDNMSILGDTFDYGPYGFLDDYNPGFICNHSDYQGRYAFDQQPSVGLWNLNALAHSLSSLISQQKIIDILTQYETEYVSLYQKNMRLKLGLFEEHPDDKKLISTLLTILARHRIDYTLFFRNLCNFNEDSFTKGKKGCQLFQACKSAGDMGAWYSQYTLRLKREKISTLKRQALMRQTNPKFILRNHLAQKAIDEAQNKGNYSEIDRLLQILMRPYEDQPQFEDYAKAPPECSKHLSISCSS